MKQTFIKSQAIFLLLVLLLCTPDTALAYIPSADFILSKTVKNSGQGYYQIKQDLVFSLPARTLSVTETWWVASADIQFLKVEGPLFTKYYLYRNGKRYTFNPQGQLSVTTTPPYFVDNFFFYRNAQDLKTALLSKKIAPQQTFRKRPTFKNDQEFAKWSEPFLALSRFKGIVAYALGYAAKDTDAAGIWVEQDRFVIRKIKLSSDVGVSVESVSELSKNLAYPKVKIYSWGTNSVQADLTRGDAVKNGTDFFKETEFAKLSSQQKEFPADVLNTSLDDFYKKFR